jgi:Flp pilus assembly protein TadD
MSEESAKAEGLIDEAKQAWTDGHLSEALRLLDASLTLQPTSFRGFALRGRLYLDLSNLEKAREDLIRAVNEVAGHIRSNRAQGDPEMEAYIQEMEAHIYKSLGDTHWNMGRRDKSREDFDKAVRFYKLATQHAPNAADAWYWVGVSEANLGRKSSARQAFEKAIELDENATDAYVDLVWLDLWSLRFRSAWRWMKIFERLYFSNPEDIQ